MNILVIGAGAWGTALAIHAAPRHAVQLWVRDPVQLDAMRLRRRNQRYLDEVAFPERLVLSSGDARALATTAGAADLVVVATPVAGLRSTLTVLAEGVGPDVPLTWLCKGFETGTGLLPHEVQQQVAPGVAAGVLSGPSFALEVARGQPTALVAASTHAAVRQCLVDAFHSATLRVYRNDDVAGVEIGGAVKNVLAIATGLCDGLSLGLNARAALITRGLAEMTRLGLALGARADTFMGLSGLGDLVLTATGDLSRNRRVGQLMAQGLGERDAIATLGHVAEGAACARTVLQRADALGVDMPITRAVVALLDARLSTRDAVQALMARGARDEG